MSAQKGNSCHRLFRTFPANRSADRYVVTDSNSATDDIVMFLDVSRLRSEMAARSNWTPGATEEMETRNRLQTALADWEFFFSFGWTDSAPSETLADRSRAAIDELTKLETGWDGYHGIAVLPAVAERALHLLDVIGVHTQIVPDVVPLSNGGLQLEWYVGIDEIEVAIAPDCTTHFDRELANDGYPIDRVIGHPRDITEFAPLFGALRL